MMIRVVIIFTILLTGKLLANECAHQESIPCDINTMQKHMPCNKGCHPSRHKMPRHEGIAIIRAVHKLQLNEEQKERIHSALSAFRQKRTQSFEAFTQKGFDKQAYIDARTQKLTQMIEAKAALYEAIYAVLDDAQKKELHAILSAMKSQRLLEPNEQ